MLLYFIISRKDTNNSRNGQAFQELFIQVSQVPNLPVLIDKVQRND